MKQKPQATAPRPRLGKPEGNKALFDHNEAQTPEAGGYQAPQSGKYC